MTDVPVWQSNREYNPQRKRIRNVQGGTDVLEEEMREIDEYGMKEFDTLDRSEKTIAILGAK